MKFPEFARRRASALACAATIAAWVAASAVAFSAPQATPAAAAKATPPAAAKDWTILIYGAADNNADGPIFGFLRDVRSAVADDPALNLVLFIDRSTGYSHNATALGEYFSGGRLYELHSTTATRLDGGAEFPEMKLDSEFEPDSADPATLQKFLRFGKAHYPARHTCLLIYSHASGVTMCPDQQANHDMGIAELTEETDDEDAVDVTALELCLMGGVEIAYQWRPGNGGFSTEVLLAIPNAGPPLDWNRIFGRIHAPGSPAAKGRSDCVDPAKLDARAFGRLAVEEGGRGRQALVHDHPEAAEHANLESVAAYDLTRVEAVKRAVDELAVALWRGNAKEAFGALRGRPGALAMNYARDEIGEHPYFDLHELLKRAAACEALDADSRAKARAAMAKVGDFMLASFGMPGYAGFEPGHHGVFIVFPFGDETRPATLGGTERAWKGFGWYSPLPSKLETTKVGSLAWCRDGAIAGDGKVENWFELLDCWYDVDNGEGGGLNGWRW